MLKYLKLYRIDVVLISLFSYLVGAQIAGNLDYIDVIYALLITLFSMNFVYSINSWADWEIDAINKPNRPIPSGKLSRKAALTYCMILLAISLVYPFFIYTSILTLVLFIALPVLGIIYSIKPIRFRNHLIPAVIITGIGLSIPIMSGYFMNNTDLSMFPFFFVLMCYCFAVVPLKDIEDSSGDKQTQTRNWLSTLGERRLLLYSLISLLVIIVLIFIFRIELILKVYLYTFVISTWILIVVYMLLKMNLVKLYKTIIRLVIVEGVLLFILLNYFL